MHGKPGYKLRPASKQPPFAQASVQAQPNTHPPEPSFASPNRAGSQSACHTSVYDIGIKCTWSVIWLCPAHFHFQLSSSTPSPPLSSARHHHLYLHLHLMARQWLSALSPAQRIGFKLEKNQTIFLFLFSKFASPTSLQLLLYSISHSKPTLLLKEK